MFCFAFCHNMKANNLALPCAGCHAPEGNVNIETIPSINNLNKKYFIKAFKEYKSDKKQLYNANNSQRLYR